MVNIISSLLKGIQDLCIKHSLMSKWDNFKSLLTDCGKSSLVVHASQMAVKVKGFKEKIIENKHAMPSNKASEARAMFSNKKAGFINIKLM